MWRCESVFFCSPAIASILEAFAVYAAGRCASSHETMEIWVWMGRIRGCTVGGSRGARRLRLRAFLPRQVQLLQLCVRRFLAPRHRSLRDKAVPGDRVRRLHRRAAAGRSSAHRGHHLLRRRNPQPARTGAASPNLHRAPRDLSRSRPAPKSPSKLHRVRSPTSSSPKLRIRE